jgi:hypothetical protein
MVPIIIERALVENINMKSPTVATALFENAHLNTSR